MSDDSVTLSLITMYSEGDERLPQYVLKIHNPKGWTLRQIASAIGCSPEWVRQLELKGMRQIAEGNRMDLSELPEASRRRKRTVTSSVEYLPPETVQMLIDMNKEASSYRGGSTGLEQVKTFNRTVQLLIDAGVPITSIARVVGTDTKTFYRRLRRWGVTSPVYRDNPKKKKGQTVGCTEPGCPIRGAHSHG